MVVDNVEEHPIDFLESEVLVLLDIEGESADLADNLYSIVALLDLADERLECSALVLALEKSCPHLGELLHSLMYVGGTVMTKPPFPVDPTFVLVGMEI